MKPSLEQTVDAICEEIEDSYTVADELEHRGRAVYVLKHTESGKYYKLSFDYNSWTGMSTDYFIEDPIEVEQVEVLVKKWKTV